MKAISTKFLPCTNSRGSRIKATEPDGASVTATYDHGKNSDQNHAAAALKLCEKMKWTGRLQGGSTKDGMVFCWLDSGSQIEAK